MILGGDLNAVPWNRTVEVMRRVGQFIDPREVAGYTGSHVARSWWKYWPLDHILHQEGVRPIRFTVLEDIGSDHYPMSAVFCVQPSERDPEPVRQGDLQSARRAVAEARRTPAEDSKPVP